MQYVETVLPESLIIDGPIIPRNRHPHELHASPFVVLTSSHNGVMEIPKFPSAAPASSLNNQRSISLDFATATANNNIINNTNRQRRRSEFARRRPRSASWLVARKPSTRRRIQPTAVFAYDRDDNRITPRLTTELTLTMTETRCPSNDEDEEESGGGGGGCRKLERIQETMSPRITTDETADEPEVISCRATITEVNNEHRHHITAHLPPLKTTLPPIRTELQASMTPNCCTSRRRLPAISVAVQTSEAILYRLRVFPTLKDVAGEENNPADSKKLSARLFRVIRFFGRVAVCQFGLAWLLTLWAILGAGAFYVTEGPRERQQIIELKDMQRELAIGLATELRQLQIADKEMEPLWSNKVQQYVAKHEKLLLIAVSSGYGEGGDTGHLWTFPGCLLFAVSVLTTLGFGAPVPRTTAGRTVAVIFASIGIPAHFLLILNLGLLFAVRLKRYGIRKRYPEECRESDITDSMPIPMWVKVTPFFVIGFYYLLGVLCFGVARLRPFSDSMLFPLEFTAAGGLSRIAGYVRILYALYLEGAVSVAAIVVALLKISATQSLTKIGLKYGLLVPA